MSYKNYRINKVVPYFKSVRDNTLKTPVSVQLLLTDNCFCKCFMCTHWQMKNKCEMYFGVYKTLFDDLLLNGCETIVFSGGDPLAHSEIEKIIKYSSGKGIHLGMITAGIHKSNFDFKLLSNFEWVRISLDAATSGTYLSIRGINAFKTVYNFIKNARSFTKVGINFTLQRNNYFEIHDIIKIAEKFELNRFMVINAIGRDFELTKEMKQFVMNKLFFRTAKTMIQENNFSDIINKFSIENSDEQVKIDEVQCIVPKLHAFIRPNGEVYPCCILGDDLHGDEITRHGYMFNIKDCSVTNVGFSSMWNNFNDLFDSKTNFTISSKCKVCTDRLYLTNLEYCKWKFTKTFI